MKLVEYLNLLLKLGESLTNMWLEELQIAIIQKDTQRLDELLGVELKFNSTSEIESAVCLLSEASKMLHEMKSETASVMLQLKKNIDFLKSTQERSSNGLDIRS